MVPTSTIILLYYWVCSNICFRFKRYAPVDNTRLNAASNASALVKVSIRNVESTVSRAVVVQTNVPFTTKPNGHAPV